MFDEDVKLTIAIGSFFERCGLNASVRRDCHNFLSHSFPGQVVRPAETQGYCSYTVVVEPNLIVQFRPGMYKLEIRVIAAAQDIYLDYAPSAELVKTLSPSNLLVYTMNKMPGISYHHYRSLQHTSLVPQSLCEDFAVFLGRSWTNRGKVTLSPGMIGSSLEARIERLSQELPLRFRPLAGQILSRLGEIMDLPLVLTHGDIVPTNIMVNPTTGRLNGFVDWAEAEMLPFGISLYGLEEILGQMTKDGFVYYRNAEQCRNAFWKKLHVEVPQLTDTRIVDAVKLARLLGILLWHGFAFDNGAINRVVEERRDRVEIQYLDAFLDGDLVIPRL